MTPLSDPDITEAELDAVRAALVSPTLQGGPQVEAFEQAFARAIGRSYAVAVASGGIGMMLALKALGLGPGQEVVAPSYSFRETAHAIVQVGATPVFADIDYWAGTLAPDKAEARITPACRALIAANSNGHPAAWSELRALADRHGLKLIEDSTEAIGSTYQGAPVGSFGDCAVFDFSQPGPLVCGSGGMVVTDDAVVAATLRSLRGRRPDERFSVVLGATPPLQVGMDALSAALGLAQLGRLDSILARRKQIEHLYHEQIRSFEGIKDPYIAPEVGEVHWFLYLVHLGTRFSQSSRDAIVDDLETEGIEAAAYCSPLHLQRHYFDRGYRRGQLFVTEKLADRAVALPFHTHLTRDKIAFIVATMKEASVNVGAGSAIYL
ncbi:DegT/DnrJ/EryC1/StrS family aminotransferase [Telmatospirillum sp.]|uniref:DegT/DnrJ/EryC1/StrS family aminotransferase n=1 Tax=Telmatospirillum sp. TaxID=2079197 RepID=UPI002850AE6C|nr:DegT/DnrJ/EryC1/StrS family aminotransferase [Telmatospirillum sp.]MDR3437690.1 DegT/DnrJ/EryC1/StrS family aminotransferase [Telmatospirillum sp.]